MRADRAGLVCDLSTCATGLADIDAGVPSPEMGERAVDEEGN